MNKKIFLCKQATSYRGEIALLGNKEWAKEELPMLAELKAQNLDILQDSQRRHDLNTGLILGLIYGIIGNLFVQFFYPVVEKLVMGNFDGIFWVDLFVSAAALIGIFFTTIEYRDRQTQSSKAIDNAKRVIDEIDDHIRRFTKMLEEETE
jgi:hypothetical protein